MARAYAYMTGPNSTGYTIEADIMGMERKDKLPDAGVLANRYTLFLDGKTDEKGQGSLRLISWEALPRIDEAHPVPLEVGHLVPGEAGGGGRRQGGRGPRARSGSAARRSRPRG